MFNFFKRNKTNNEFYEVAKVGNEYALIKQTNNGTEVISSYTRKRDAVRGAQRKGITLANA